MTLKMRPLKSLLKKKTLKNDFKIVSALLPTIARSRLFALLLGSFILSTALRASLALVSAAHGSSQGFSALPAIYDIKKNSPGAVLAKDKEVERTKEPR